jgi:hypothetical protein
MFFEPFYSASIPKKPPGFFNQSLDRVKLPSSLQTLTFGHLGKLEGEGQMMGDGLPHEKRTLVVT